MATIAVPVINNDEWNEFLDEFENSPELWDSKCTEYKNKAIKNKALNRLLQIYKKIKADANLHAVKCKIINIRSCYRRELNKIRRSERFAAHPDDVHVPSLWYFEKLHFLKSQECKTEFVSFDYGDDSVDETSNPPPKKSRINCVKEDLLKEAMQNLNDIPSKQDMEDLNYIPTHKTETDGDIYSSSWALSFNKLDEEQQLYAKKAIDDIFILGQLKKLNFNIIPPILFSHDHQNSERY